MRTLAVRGIRLSEASFNAWKTLPDLSFARPGRGSGWVSRWLDRDPQGRQAINLGSSALELPSGAPVWNNKDVVRLLSSPRKTQQLLGIMQPLAPSHFPANVWIKRPGRQGSGATQMTIEAPVTNLGVNDTVQLHVDGQEMRLITVGHRVVQQHLRHGPNGAREYAWVRQRDVPQRAKEAVRQAAALLPGRNIIAWDVIVHRSNYPFILEGNTCPGMGTATASRIYREMTRVEQEGVIDFE